MAGYYGDSFGGAQSAALNDEARRSGREMQMAHFLQSGVGAAASRAMQLLGLMHAVQRDKESADLNRQYLEMQKSRVPAYETGELGRLGREDAFQGTFDPANYKGLPQEHRDALGRINEESLNRQHQEHERAKFGSEILTERDNLNEGIKTTEEWLAKGGDKPAWLRAIPLLPDTATQEAAKNNLEDMKKRLAEISKHARVIEEENKKSGAIIYVPGQGYFPSRTPPNRPTPPLSRQLPKAINGAADSQGLITPDLNAPVTQPRQYPYAHDEEPGSVQNMPAVPGATNTVRNMPAPAGTNGTMQNMPSPAAGAAVGKRLMRWGGKLWNVPADQVDKALKDFGAELIQ